MLKRLVSIALFICLLAFVLSLGGYTFSSAGQKLHLRDPKQVLSPITQYTPNLPNNNNGGNNGNGYTFDPNAKIGGNSGNSGYTFDPNAQVGGDNNGNNYQFDPNAQVNDGGNDPQQSQATLPNGEIDPNAQAPTGTIQNGENQQSSDNQQPAQTDVNGEQVTNPNDQDSNSPQNTEAAQTEKPEAKETQANKETEPQATTAPTAISKIISFVIDGTEKVVTSDTTADFIKWLQNNINENSDIQYNVTDEPADNSTPTTPNYSFDQNASLSQYTSSNFSSIPVIDKLPTYNDYNRNTFEKPTVSYTLNGTKVNRNDYAWKTSPYFNESDFTYTCPYTGKVITDMDDKKDDKDFGNLDYDHIVPLKSAYLRGAKDWTEEQKNAYAYDQFVGVDVLNSANRSKSDKGPAEWLPDVNRGSYCYSWLMICDKYNLSMTQEEIDICNAEIEKAIKNGETVTFMGGK